MQSYFIFVFHEREYEDQKGLGLYFKFPTDNMGAFKLLGDGVKRYGNIVEQVNLDDLVIWTISGNSQRRDKKTFWGKGKIIRIDSEERKWDLASTEFDAKIKTEIIFRNFPEAYQALYKQKTGLFNIGFKGTIKIDEFQYDFILNELEKYLVSS